MSSQEETILDKLYQRQGDTIVPYISKEPQVGNSHNSKQRWRTKSKHFFKEENSHVCNH